MAEMILVVDDEPEVAAAIAELLRTDGYDAETINSSSEAVTRISSALYDLIVSDIVMPGLSGLQLLALVKARIPSPEVILVTGYSSRERAMEALNHGAFAYLEEALRHGGAPGAGEAGALEAKAGKGRR